MPEIERVARIELNAGALGKVVGKDGKRQKLLDFVQEVAGELTLDDIEPSGYLGLTLFVRLSEHVYAEIHTQEELNKWMPIRFPTGTPPCTGCLLQTAQNAFNMIFMTDYIFQVVTSVKSLPQTDAPAVA